MLLFAFKGRQLGLNLFVDVDGLIHRMILRPESQHSPPHAPKSQHPVISPTAAFFLKWQALK